jgi:glutathione S-transferase
MKLYCLPQNANTRKIRAVANEVDLRLDLETIDLRSGQGQSPEFLKINPNGKIPALTDGDFKLFESNAIITYLAAKAGRKDLLPTEPQARAHVDQWLHWQNAHLSTAIGKIAMERYYKPLFNMGAADPVKVEEGLKDADRFLTVLDGWLATRDYVCNTLTVADFSLAGTLSIRRDISLDIGKYAHLNKWLTRIETRPAWVHAQES